MTTDDDFYVPEKLVRVREMFVVPEAYVIALAIFAAWTPVAMVVRSPDTAARGGLAAAAGVLLLAAPMLIAAIGLLRRHRSARALMAYATVVTGVLLAWSAEVGWLAMIYVHQAVLVALLWLPRIDAVLTDTYRTKVIPAVPLVGRRRRAWFAIGFYFAMLATGLAAVLAVAY